jgi:hypothetical protein
MMNLKRCGGKRPWPNLWHYPGIFLEEVRKTTTNFVRIANLRFQI